MEFHQNYFDQGEKIPRNFLSQIINAGKEGLNHVQDVLINLEIAAMYADAEAVVKIAEVRIRNCMTLNVRPLLYEEYL